MNFNRRDFLKVGLLSASALTFTACGRPVEHGIVSQYQMPEYKVLGSPSFWATTCTELRSDCSVSVKTVENRAIQVIGMPGHFFSKGGVTTAAVSSLNALYHPDRIPKAVGVKDDEEPGEVVGAAVKKGDAVIITDRLCGSVGDALVSIAQETGAKIWVCDSLNSVRERRILKAVTGRAELPLLDLENRDYFVTVGSNCIAESYTPTRTEWAYGRFRKTPGKLRGRMVSFSSRMNATDANSDMWEPIALGSEPAILGALGKLLQDKGKGSFPSWAALTPEEAAEKCGVAEDGRKKFAHHLEMLADRLAEANSPLVVGGFQGPNGDATVFLAHTITKMLNGDVTTFEPDNLVGDKKSGSGLFLTDEQVADALKSAKTVLVDNVDVVYRFPWLAEAFKAVKTRIVAAPLPNDTTGEATVLVPVRTWMEDWSDLLVTSKTGDWYGIGQPAVKNQHPAAQSVLGFYLTVAEAVGVSVKDTSPRAALMGDLDQGAWEDLQVRGGHWKQDEDLRYPHAAAYPPPPTDNAGKLPKHYSVFADLEPMNVNSLGEVPSGMSFTVLHTHLGDGQLSDRPWLQELPDAMTTVVWDSWIEINAAYAKQNGISRHDVVTVTVGSQSIKGSAYPSEFIHPQLVGIPSGRGHKRAINPNFAKLGWVSEGSNPKTLLPGTPGSNGYFGSTASGATVAKGVGSKLLATFDQRVYNLPRHILPE